MSGLFFYTLQIFRLGCKKFILFINLIYLCLQIWYLYSPVFWVILGLLNLLFLPIYLHFKSTFTIFLCYFVSLNFILYIFFFHCSILTLWASLVKGCLFLSVFSISVFVFASLLRACLSHYHSLSSLCLSEVCLK